MKKTVCMILSIMLCSLASAQTKTEKYEDIGRFTGIDASYCYNIILRKAPDYRVSLEVDAEYLPYLKIENDDGELSLSRRNNIPKRLQRHCPDVLDVVITAPELQKLELSGACRFLAEDTFETDNFQLEVSGAGKITDLSVEADRIEAEISGAAKVKMKIRSDRFLCKATGAGKLNLNLVRCRHFDFEVSGAAKAVIEGRTEEANFNASGAGKVDALALQADHVFSELSGASFLSIWAVKSLHPELSGASSLRYKGNPNIKTIYVNRVCSIKSVE